MEKSNSFLLSYLNKYFEGKYKYFYDYMVDDSAETINIPRILIPVVEDNIDGIRVGANDVLHISQQKKALAYLKKEAKINPNELFVADDIDEICYPLSIKDLKDTEQDLA